MILAPSILSMDYSDFSNQLDILNDNVEWIHFDVMDGHFVPNLSFGPDIFKAFRRNSSLFMDVHLMVDNPEYFSNVFIDKGCDNITFHYEVFNNTEDCLKLIKDIKSKYVKCGISIKPNTPVEDIIPLLEDVDLVLVMSVEPGYGGQKFIENSYRKIKQLDEYRKLHNLNYLIEVDGGVNGQNAYNMVDCGCDVLVAGSYIFKGDMINNINSITFDK